MTEPAALEKKRARDRKYYADNRDARLAYQAQNYQANKETIKTQIIQYQREHGQQQLLRAIEYLGGECSICGFDNPAALQFHHRDPATKKHDIAGNHLARKWETLVEELDKCDLLCANCHSIHHYGHRTNVSGIDGTLKTRDKEYPDIRIVHSRTYETSEGVKPPKRGKKREALALANRTGQNQITLVVDTDTNQGIWVPSTQE